MNCRKCEEIMAAAARAGAGDALPDRAEAHVAACASCREFRARMDAVAAALDRWAAPERGDRAAGARAMLVSRLAAGVPAPANIAAAAPRAALGRLFRHPALIGVLGAAAAGGGAAVAPGWAQQAIAGWAAGAALLASLVLLYHGRPAIARGDYR